MTSLSKKINHNNMQIKKEWQMQALFHKSWLGKVKKQTKAKHVSHYKKIDGTNAIWIKNGKKELKYGGKKDFYEFTPQDYQNAIAEFNKL